MYRTENTNQRKLEDFGLPFGGRLNKNNQWIILRSQTPWAKLEHLYAKNFSDSQMGAPAKSFRITFESLLIKEKLQYWTSSTGSSCGSLQYSQLQSQINKE